MRDTPRTDQESRTPCVGDATRYVVSREFAEHLERELAEMNDRFDGSELTHAATLAELWDCKSQLAAERALADRLALCVDDLSYEYNPMEAKRAFEAWREARRVS